MTISIFPLIGSASGADPRETAALARQAGRLADHLSPALAQVLLAPAAAALGTELVQPQAVRTSRLLARFHYAQQMRWARAIDEAGFDVVYLKGFANAHLHYREPALRAIGDLDVLVRAAERDRLIAHLARQGFVFAPGPVRPWGFISDASYMPFVAADGQCNIDIHVQPDAYPAHRSLDTARVFAAARRCALGGFAIRVPSPEHALLLSATNAAKDKFGPYSVRKLIDAHLMLNDAGALDWHEIIRIATDGRFAKPLRVFLALLHGLGLGAAQVPPVLNRPPIGLAGRAFECLLRDYRALFPARPGPATLLAREILLCTEPEVSARNAWLRFTGLLRPRSGIPAAAAGQPGQSG